MKKQTLAVALGTAIAATLMGSTNPASATNMVGGPGSSGSGLISRPSSGGTDRTNIIIGQVYDMGVPWPLYHNDIMIDGTPTGTNNPLLKPNLTYNFTFANPMGSGINEQGPGVKWKGFILEMLSANTTFTGTPTATTSGWTGTISNMGKKVLFANPSFGATVIDFQEAATFTFSVTTDATNFQQGDEIRIKAYATPEPLTILGTGVVLGAIPALKKEYAKRAKKKSGNA